MYSIGVIAPTPFFSDRGCHVRINGVVGALQKRGNRVSLCTYHLGRNMPGLEIHRIPRIPWYHKTSAGPSLHKFYLDLMLLATSARAFSASHPDLLHVFLHEGAFLGGWYKRFRRIPLVVDLQGSLTDELKAHNFLGRRKLVYSFFDFLERFSLRNADAVITSSAVIAGIVKDGGMAPAEKVHVIPDGVDTDLFRPAGDRISLRARLGLPPRRKIVIFVGVLTPYQGIDVILQAAARLDKASTDPYFVIVGYPDEDKYRRKAEALGIARRVRFTGRLDYREMIPQYLAAADIAVSPKMSLSEANLKLQEYMAAGLPTVVFDNAVNREIMGDAGVYAAPGSEESFAAALGALLQDEERAKSLGRRARERAEGNFSWSFIGGKIMDVYRRLFCLILCGMAGGLWFMEAADEGPAAAYLGDKLSSLVESLSSSALILLPGIM